MHTDALIAMASVLLLAAGANAQPGGETAAYRPIRVDAGVFRYPDGEEVALFGANYHPMGWHQFTNMKAAGADFRREIARDLDHMQAMGVQVVRVHFFDRQHANRRGDLIEGEPLAVWDIFLDELDRRGLYLFLTPICWWSSPVALPDAFSAHVSKMGLMYAEEAVAAAERFTQALLTRRNPYTGRALYEEPALAVIEIVNEPWYWPYEAIADPDYDPEWMAQQTDPETLARDLADWRARWEGFLGRRDAAPSSDLYADFQAERMSAFLARMVGAIRATGAEQPIASALFETARNPGVLRAIGESAVDAVSDGWYIGGFDTLHEGVNLLDDWAAQAYDVPEPVRHKARIVYEWDVCRTYDTVGMYPVLARRWRSMGAQIACHFQYDAAITAPFNTDWGPHYLNSQTTPAKAVAFYAAAKAFTATPRGEQYTNPPDDVVFHGTAVSFQHNQVLHVADDEVIHAHPVGAWHPIDLPASPARITGRGDSPYATYTGSGWYRIETVRDSVLRLATTRNAAPTGPVNAPFFDNGTLGVVRVQLDIAQERFGLRLPGWEDYRCTTSTGVPVAVQDGGVFDATPGETYLLYRASGAR